MSRQRLTAVLPLALVLVSPVLALGDEPEAEPIEGEEEAEATVERLAEEVERLRAREARAREEFLELRGRVDKASQKLNRPPPFAGRLSGYVDFGFFSVGGDGSGLRADLGHRYFPEYRDVVPGPWVLMGDPLSTAINARGEPADTGPSRALAFDAIDASGNPTFLVNALGLSLLAGLGDEVVVEASFDLVPRGRDPSDPEGSFVGDFLDVKLAFVDWRPDLTRFSLRLSAGKFDSVLGVEYRDQDAPRRIAVTPSLVCRYTCGRPVGVGARASVFDDRLRLQVAVTNGSAFVAHFPFQNELDRNAAPTISARLSVTPASAEGLEAGASGAVGAQDGQPDGDVVQWHTGIDLQVRYEALVVAAEVVKGRAEGRTETGAAPCGLAPCLDYEAAYWITSYPMTKRLVPYGRLDYRRATHVSGADFVYLSRLVRLTAGVRFEIRTGVVWKMEYTWNRELGKIPEFPNDVFTSSLVTSF